MLSRWILSLVLLLSVGNSFSYNDAIVAKSSFKSREGDSAKLIKNRLKYKAFRSAITQGLRKLNLSPAKFWKEYKVKFDEYFGPLQLRLRKRFVIEDENFPPEDFLKELRVLRLEEKWRFFIRTLFSKSISRYSERDSSSSSRNPHTKFLTLDVSLNKKKLSEIYYDWVNGDEKFKKIRNLFIEIRPKFEGGTWQDIGIDGPNQVRVTLFEYWKKYFVEKLEYPFERVEMITDSSEKVVEKKLKELGEVDLEKEKKESLILVANMNVKKVFFNEFLVQKQFSIGGEILLKDVKGEKIISFKKFPVQSYPFDVLQEKDLKSKLIGAVYRIPLLEFRNLKEKISEIPSESLERKIRIKNFLSMDNIYSLEKLLELEGHSLFLKTQMSSYDSEGVIFRDSLINRP